MSTLSPPLFLAGLQQYADEAALAPTEEITMSWSRRYTADLEFVHRVGMASHRDPVCRLTAWPLAQCATVADLIAYSHRHRLGGRVPCAGDLVVLSPSDLLYPNLVAVVLQVLEYGLQRAAGPTKVQLAYATPVEGGACRMHLGQLTRWCGPSRGDEIIQWGELRREVA